MSSPRALVLQFPGVNCEYESARALEDAGASASILRWNEDPSLLAGFDLFLLPGGFSYQDRIRAGVVAAKEPVLEALAEEAEKGKPILGICNGAQVLVEAGFIPGLRSGEVDLALAPNRMVGREGYFSDWSTLEVSSASPSWLSPLQGELLPIPFAHGEGRFTSRRKGLFEELEKKGQIALRYRSADGGEASWPDNPNGSLQDAAGICNPRGNVLAMMPHPERAAWLGQVPEELPGHWAELRRKARGDWKELQSDGPGMKILRAMVSAAALKKEACHAS
ncbi:MAG: phosphoribosylformylglycinamidine synthase I [Candidatus Krumholzibacteria bacterium]|jgi:phosphoribosylformylglycinamidine synthase|nr:phosphoribosylformylglycinamidine synthase I [Candidatus Krumholzibacteria bacterium]MDP6669672.1 phosphoribosylformylglycinamidine synthase I [Candidatus Krumholzibacteria bacterium]MDP6797564.1 phosphoribosylformylglycinamidine synthase I [Candidatus Krumholzibacteria bacterium]MDP7021239.1 phosphoribosylformylglycinamidine synthase I [Candidatus Krumholzibacteria bacterium]